MRQTCSNNRVGITKTLFLIFCLCLSCVISLCADAAVAMEKEEAIAELVNLDTDSAIAAVSVAFDEADPGLRMPAVDNLAKSKNPLTDQLIGQAFLKDEDTQVAIKAVHALHGQDSLVGSEFLAEIFGRGHKNEAVLKEVLKTLYPGRDDVIDKQKLYKYDGKFHLLIKGALNDKTELVFRGGEPFLANVMSNNMGSGFKK